MKTFVLESALDAPASYVEFYYHMYGATIGTRVGMGVIVGAGEGLTT